jgi:sensor histidine kinase regulating citrate/malate metabolism
MLTGLSGQFCYIVNVQNIEAILDLVNDGIIIVDKKCIISFFNKGAERIIKLKGCSR